MSKGNLFLGKARGKVGSVVFSNLNGQQITRAYQPSVKNPRTTAQLITRASFATCSVASSILSSIIDHSFDGIAEGEKNRQEFIKRNMAAMRSIYDENGLDSLNPFILPKGNKQIKPFKWILSGGNLGYIEPKATRNFYETFDNGGQLFLWDELKTAYPFVKPGAQITFVVITYKSLDNTSLLEYRVRKARLVFAENFDPYLYEPGQGGLIGRFSAGQSTGLIIDARVLDVPRCEGDGISFFGGAWEPTADSDALPGVYMNMLNYYSNSGTSGTIGLNDAFFDELDEIPIAVGIIGTNYDASKSDPWVHTTSKMMVDTDRWDDNNDNIGTYASRAAVNKESAYYLDQATATEEGQTYTLEEILSGTVKAQSMATKAIVLGRSNSYGPVAEGVPITYTFNVPYGYVIRTATVKISNGETDVTAQWAKNVLGGRTLTLEGVMPQTTSFPSNISFLVQSQNSSWEGVAALRVNISKANA